MTGKRQGSDRLESSQTSAETIPSPAALALAAILLISIAATPIVGFVAKAKAGPGHCQVVLAAEE